MKFKIYTMQPFPYGMAATNRIINYGVGLVNQGVEVECFTINATENTEQVPRNLKQGSFKGIKYKYASTNVRSKSFIRKHLRDVYDYYLTCKDLLTSDAKRNMVFMNSFSKEFGIVLLAKLSGKKIIKELCEYPYYKECLMSKLTLKFLFPLYDGFVVISENLLQLAKKFKNKNAKIVKIPILVDPNRIADVTPFNHSKPYIFHGGTLTESKDGIISTLIAFGEAKKELEEDVDFIIAGPPSFDIPKINETIKKYHLENNVKFLGVLSRDEIVKYQLGASLSILNKNETIQNIYGFSTKLGEILLSKTPVITTTIGEANLWLEDGISAFITTPHNPIKISNEIIRAFKNKNLRENIAMNGYKVALQNFDAEYQGKKFHSFLNSI